MEQKKFAPKMKIASLFQSAAGNVLSGTIQLPCGLAIAPGTRVVVFEVPSDRRVDRGPSHELFIEEGL